MNKDMDINQLHVEWQRLELLTYHLQQVREDKTMVDDDMASLANLQMHCNALRMAADSPWKNLAKLALPPLAYDILICAAAVELAPKLSWQFQLLNAGQKNQPYPTRALIHQLLALNTASAMALQQLLADGSVLFQQDLLYVDREETGPYQAIRPTTTLINHLSQCIDHYPTPQGSYRIETLAVRDDLVLPVAQMTLLDEYLLWIKQRDKVVNQWKGLDVGGPVALFSGPSGTGKTFAATVIATELAWPLFRVDLGAMVSIYIGETEQNINRLFDVAHNKPMILQFDEADSLFGKRGEVKEARDRYANMTVSHLLARIENHHGPIILTSNLSDQIDSAFIRRFQTVVNFPRPDATARAALWRRLLPSQAPLEDNVDVTLLSKTVNLTGGRIRNAALHAAYLAAGKDKAIGLEEIAIAVWREIGKENYERSLITLGALAHYLPTALRNE
ncbi:MAG: ATP-binding protein [Gammaproteobacteria bacterium]|nr:ATP-binding protein [Gammaproteobacteria bacterium]